MDDKKHIVAVTAIIKNKNKFLVVKRGNNEIAYPGKWAFPGGKVEKGQNIFETLRREVFEEVGLENYKKYLKDYTFLRPDGHNVVGFCFLVKTKSDGVKLSTDFEDYKWVTPDEFNELDHIEGMEEEVFLAFNDEN